MKRKIIEINQEKCNGCGLCAEACHEGAIGMIDGKAQLLRDDYCDGLGDCLPACPTGAITFVEREAEAYNEAAVKVHLEKRKTSRLANWPVQIKLAPMRAPWLDGVDLLIAADCTAYAYGNFHDTFIRGRVTLIGCPKLDEGDYADKLTAIFSSNDIRSITVVRMEVPCCGGIEHAVKRAISASGKDIPCDVVTVSIKGTLLGKR